MLLPCNTSLPYTHGNNVVCYITFSLSYTGENNEVCRIITLLAYMRKHNVVCHKITWSYLCVCHICRGHSLDTVDTEVPTFVPHTRYTKHLRTVQRSDIYNVFY